MTKTKKIFIAFLSGLLVICAGFAALLSRPAAQANAEENELPRLSLDYLFEENERYGTATLSETETYSETWVINEKWVYTSAFSVNISGSTASYNDINVYAFDSFEVSIDSRVCVRTSSDLFSFWYSGSYTYCEPESVAMDYDTWSKSIGTITFYSDTSAEEYRYLRDWLEASATKQTDEAPVVKKYTLTFMNGEDVLGTVEAAEGDKLSALELPFFLPVVAGKDFKGWSYEENGELLDLEAETVTGAKTLYAVYEDVVPDTPDNPDTPENPDKSFKDKVKDFGDKASEWLEQNVGLSISGGAVIVILIAAAILIFSKRR